jgi:DNA-binding GntR family transcriptional regulator
MMFFPGRFLLHTVYRIRGIGRNPRAGKDAVVESLASPKTLVEQAYEVILDAICAGTLKPGERLTQDSVARRLNVSRQPVHNALLVLKAQGFVEDAGRRGLAVVPLDAKLFEAIYQFRSAIEPLAVRLATPRLTGEAKKRGRALIAQGRAAAEAADSRRLVQADMDFHSFIYELSENSLILQTMHLNWQHLRRAMGEVLRFSDLSRRVWREHEAILAAMARGDAEGAARLIYDHVVRAYEDVKSALPDAAAAPSVSAA